MIRTDPIDTDNRPEELYFTSEDPPRPFFRVLSPLLITLSLSILALSWPLALRWGLEQALDLGGITGAKVGYVAFNPFSGRLRVRQLNLDPHSSRNPGIEDALLKISLSALWRREVIIHHLDINRPLLETRHLAPLLTWLPALFPPDDPLADKGEAWSFSLRSMSLRNGQIQWQDEKMQLDVSVDTFESEGFSPLTPARFTFEGNINGASARILGNLQPFTRNLTGNLRVILSGLELAPLGKRLAPFANDLSGRVKMDSMIEVERQPGVKLRLRQGGALQVENGRLASEALSLSQESLNWEGTLDMTLFPEAEPRINAQGNFQGREVSLNLPRSAIAIGLESGRGELEMLYGPGREKEPTLTQSSRFALRNIKMKWDQVELSEERLGWNGSSKWHTPADEPQARWQVQGDLQGQAMKLNWPSAKLDLSHQGLNAKIDMDRRPNAQGHSRLLYRGNLELRKLEANHPSATLAEKLFRWRGQLRLQPTDKLEQSLAIRGQANATGLESHIHSRHWKLVHQGAWWSGEINANLGDTTTWDAQGRLEATRVVLSHEGAGGDIFQSERVLFRDLKARQPGISSIGAARLQSVRVPRSGAETIRDVRLLPLGLGDSLSVPKMVLTDSQHLASDNVEVNEGKVRLTRRLQGRSETLHSLLSAMKISLESTSLTPDRLGHPSASAKTLPSQTGNREATASESFALVLQSLRTQEEASTALNKWKARGVTARTQEKTSSSGSVWHAIVTGNYPDRATANKALGEFRQKFPQQDVFLVKTPPPVQPLAPSPSETAAATTSTPPSPVVEKSPPSVHALQLGAFHQKAEILEAQAKWRKSGIESRIVDHLPKEGRPWMALVTGNFATRQEAQQELLRLRKQIPNLDAYPVTAPAGENPAPATVSSVSPPPSGKPPTPLPQPLRRPASPR
ncbi:MAG: SPOR domain-containing protein [Magnetococcales bacterium]|nr:SPOR domain-containing protein [Magnetococcales bacterium]